MTPTHRPFPPNMTALDVVLYVVEAMDESFARVLGGTMSFRALIRSARDSSKEASPKSEASDSSESGNQDVSIEMVCI